MSEVGPSEATSGDEPDAVRLALTAKLDELWAQAGRLTRNDATMPVELKERLLDRGRLGIVTRTAGDTSTEPAESVGDLRLSRARDLVTGGGDPAAIAASGLRLADALDRIALSASPDPVEVAELLLTWLARVPRGTASEEAGPLVLAFAVATMEGNPYAVVPIADLTAWVTPADDALRRLGWVARRRILDLVAADDLDGEVVLEDLDRRDAVARVASQLATDSAVLAERHRGDHSAARTIIERADLITAVCTRNEIPAGQEVQLQELAGLPTDEGGLVAWWGLRAGRYVIDGAVPDHHVAALDVVTATASAAMGRTGEATGELVRVLDRAGAGLSWDVRMMIALSTLQSAMASGNLLEALTSEGGAKAVGQLADDLAALEDDPDLPASTAPRFRLFRQLAHLSRWGPVQSASSGHVQRALGRTSRLRGQGLDELDPHALRGAVEDLLREYVDGLEPWMLATGSERVSQGVWLAAVAAGVRRRAGAPDVYPDGMEAAMRLREDPTSVMRRVWPTSGDGDLDERVLNEDVTRIQAALAQPSRPTAVIRLVAARLSGRTSSAPDGLAPPPTAHRPASD